MGLEFIPLSFQLCFFPSNLLTCLYRTVKYNLSKTHHRKKIRKKSPWVLHLPKSTNMWCSHMMWNMESKYIYKMQNIYLAYIDSKGLFLRKRGNSRSSMTYSTLQHCLYANTGDLQSSDQLKVEWLFQQNVYLCFCVLLCWFFSIYLRMKH